MRMPAYRNIENVIDSQLKQYVLSAFTYEKLRKLRLAKTEQFQFI